MRSQRDNQKIDRLLQILHSCWDLNLLLLKDLGLTILRHKDKDSGDPLGIPAFLVLQKKSGLQGRSTTSGSSREESYEDEVEGDIETSQNMDPADAKRMRRKFCHLMSQNC